MTKCRVCKKATENCSCFVCMTCQNTSQACICVDTCKKCLVAGRLENGGECICCSKCEKDVCTCHRTCSPKQVSSSVNTSKPPDLSLLKNKDNLPIYIASLRRWSRIGGVLPELQADIVLMHAPQQYPELYMELEAELGVTILNNKNGIDLIISNL